jgi:hypothetical protein
MILLFISQVISLKLKIFFIYFILFHFLYTFYEIILLNKTSLLQKKK